MELGKVGTTDGAKLARIGWISIAAFLAASVAAAVGYPEWMWSLVFAGLVLAPAVLVVTAAAAVVGRRTRA